MVSENNVLAIKQAYADKKPAGSFLPAIYVVELTSRCNLDCIMCPNSRLPEESLGDMTVQDFALVTSSISSFAELVMLYFMGEPLLHPKFCDLIRQARSSLSGVLVVSTNATTLDSEKAKALIDCGIDIVICCIDRWSAKEYEQIRRGASFQLVIENIERMLRIRSGAQKPTIIIKALRLKMADDEQALFNSYWSALGGVPVIGWVDTWAGQMPGLVKISDELSPVLGAERVPCSDLWFKMVVNWQRDVVLCCHNYNYSHKLGRIDSSESVREIWQGQPLHDLRRAHLLNNFNVTKICSSCREWGTPREFEAYLNLGKENYPLVF